jgi:serine/threonine-protein kinase
MGVSYFKEDEIERVKPKIGEGQMSKVYKGLFKNIPVAIKKMKNLKEENVDDQNCLSEILNEIRCSQHVQNENIPKFYGLWKRNGHYCLVYEYISGKTLKETYSKLEFSDKIKVMYQLSEILVSIHSLHLIHRDIKPSNIMISDDFKVRLIDFGVSKISQKTQTLTGTTSGTTRYIAPECFQMGNDQSFHINNKIDIWSTGCLMSEIFSGILPWKNKVGSDLIVMKKLLQKEEFPIPESMIEDVAVVEVIRKCLNVSPEKRISAEELAKILKEKMDSL